MKPDWKDAPEWANYLAQDKNGEWWWYGKQPRIAQCREQWDCMNGGGREMVKADIVDWRETLETRPE